MEGPVRPALESGGNPYSASRLPGLLLRGGGGSLAVKVAGQALLLGAMAGLARYLGADQYGRYIYVLAWVRVLVMVCRFGGDTLLLRYVPAYVRREQWAPLKGLLLYSVLAAALSWLVLAGLIWFLMVQPGRGGTAALRAVILAGIAVLIVQSVADLARAVLQGLGYVVRAAAPDQLVRPVALFLFVVVAGSIMGADRTGALAMWGALFAASIVLLTLLYALWSRFPRPGGASGVVFRNREWIRVGSSLLFISGAQLLLTQVDTLMVGAMIGTAEAGIYNGASRLAGLVVFGLGAVAAIAAPTIASLHAAGDEAGLRHLFRLTARGLILTTVPVAALLLLCGGWALSVFGPEFVPGRPALSILVVAQTVNAAAGPVGYLMTMTGRERFMAGVVGCSLLANIGLNLALIPVWGLVGGAVATAITTIAWNVVLIVRAIKYLGYNPTVFQFGES